MKMLYIGDVHAVPGELDDCGGLVRLIEKVLTQHPDAQVCFLGDQHHTHGVVHLVVMSFWREVFRRLGGAERCVALVGNHDQSGLAGSSAHVMDSYEACCRIAWPALQLGPITLVSYAENDDFLKRMGSGQTLVCHQSFDGSRENGHWIKNGIVPQEVPYHRIISGHIHTPQEFGKVWYPGAPRWRTKTDGKTQDRAIWLVEHDAAGDIISRTPFATAGYCRPIRVGIDTPERPLDVTEDADWRIEIQGPTEYVLRRRQELKGLGRRISSVFTDQGTIQVRESRGIDQSFKEFTHAFRGTHGTPTGRLAQMAESRLRISS